MTTLSALMQAIVTALAANHGTYDLSGDDQVQRGRYDVPPPVLPFAAVASPDIQSGTGPPLGSYVRTLAIDVEAWAQVTDLTTDTRTVAGEALADELMAALETARTDLSTALSKCRTFVVRAVNTNDDADPISPGMARIMLQIELTYRRTTGA